jgi:hypothetical protein
VARDSGRPCGCDPASDHPCEAHDAYRDESETVVGNVTITGPAGLGWIELQVRGEIFTLARFEAEDLAIEILRRLAPRA